MEIQQKILPVAIEKLTPAQYMAYTSEVIQNRALPDVRDGLKPVQRRVLYVMRASVSKGFVKCAKIVGDTMGVYHPHGDSSIYGTLVNLAQDFKENALLVTPQGNFGSVDGHPAAAMRYTEAMLSDLGKEGLFQDMDKDVVDFVPNYDGTTEEPSVLPVRFPQLLVNGTTGIAVGIATDCLPHNFNEVLDVAIAMNRNPDLSKEEVVQLMPAPDFPTGGTVYQLSGYYEALETGRGSVRVKANYDIIKKTTQKKGRNQKRSSFANETVLEINEIPYNVNKTEMFNAMVELLQADAQLNEWVDRIQDHSAQEKVSLCVYLSRAGEDLGDLVFNRMAQALPRYFTKSYSYNLNVIGNQQEKYRTVSIVEVFKEFLAFRKEVITRKQQHVLKETQQNLHKILGLIKVLHSNDSIDEAIALIKANDSKEQASLALQKRFELDELQAGEVLKMQLSKLTSLEKEELQNKHQQMVATVADLTDFLASPERLEQSIEDDLLELKRKFGAQYPRRTQISHEDLSIKGKGDFIKEEDYVVVLTRDGYIKSLPNEQIGAQRRNGKGKSTIAVQEEDGIKTMVLTSSHENIFFFTEKGKVFSKKAWDLPSNDKGRHYKNIFPELEEDIAFMVGVSDEQLQGVGEPVYVVLVTQEGKIRRTKMSSFASANRRSGLLFYKLPEEDKIVFVGLAKENDHLMMVSNTNTVNRFVINEENLRPLEKSAMGVEGRRLRKGEKIISAIVVEVDPQHIRYDTAQEPIYVQDDNGDISFVGKKYRIDGYQDVQVLNCDLIDEQRYLLTVSENGVGKRVALSLFKVQKRRAIGVVLTKDSPKSGALVKAILVNEDDEVILTSTNKSMKIAVAGVSDYSRTASGVYLMDITEGDRVIDVIRA